MLGPERLRVALSGDGADSMVQALATRDESGLVQVLVWNGTLDQTKQDGAPLLERQVRIRITGLPAGRYRREHLRVDLDHSNVARHWRGLGAPDWPDPEGWARLRAGDHLEDFEPAGTLQTDDSGVTVAFDLPMPGVSLIRLTRLP
jgi:xylan 1,4-beta-xylosidase